MKFLELDKMLDRIFVKKTKRGNILKIVREHYLRDDLSCSSELCLNQICNQSNKTSKSLLDKEPKSISSKFTKSHYIVPDTNVILHQVCLIYGFNGYNDFCLLKLDVLEHNTFKNVIICQTVLSEVKNQSISIYQRLVQLINSPDRKFICFVNEFHK